MRFRGGWGLLMGGWVGGWTAVASGGVCGGGGSRRELGQQGGGRPVQEDAGQPSSGRCSTSRTSSARPPKLSQPTLTTTAGKMKALAKEVRGFSGRTRLPIYAASAILVRYDSGGLHSFYRVCVAIAVGDLRRPLLMRYNSDVFLPGRQAVGLLSRAMLGVGMLF